MRLFFAVLLLLISSFALAAPLQVFVSVAPQKSLLERVGGDQVAAQVMVAPGRSPATYEPQPRQLISLERADLYLAIGVPFETAWLPRIRRTVPTLRIEDLRSGLRLHKLDHDHGGAAGDGLDSHVWTDPRRCLQMAARIRDLLTELRPEQRDLFAANYGALAESLRTLDAELQAQLSALPSRLFLVFHPAWGYFAERYGLEQVAIEHEGKEPGARALAALIERARAEGVRKVFVQPQFSQRLAETVARAIGGQVIVVDPLAEDCMASLRRIAASLAETET
jgi:zinc transport system substrate-binding protein